MRIVAIPPEGANYPRVIFDHEESSDCVTVTIGEKALPALTTLELAAFMSAVTQLVQHGDSGSPTEPRTDEAGPPVPA